MIETNYFRDGNVESEILPEPTHGHEEREHTQEITDLIKRVEQKNFTEIQERGVLNRISKLSETPLEIIENNFKAFTLNFYKEYVISHQSIDLNGVAPLQGSVNDKKYGYLWGLKREILSNIGDGIIGKFFEHQMLHNFGIQVHEYRHKIFIYSSIGTPLDHKKGTDAFLRISCIPMEEISINIKNSKSERVIITPKEMFIDIPFDISLNTENLRYDSKPNKYGVLQIILEDSDVGFGDFSGRSVIKEKIKHGVMSYLKSIANHEISPEILNNQLILDNNRLMCKDENSNYLNTM